MTNFDKILKILREVFFVASVIEQRIEAAQKGKEPRLWPSSAAGRQP